MNNDELMRMRMLAGIAVSRKQMKVLTENTDTVQQQLVRLLLQEAEKRASNEASMGRQAVTADAILSHAQRISQDVMTHVESLIRMEFEEGRQG